MRINKGFQAWDHPYLFQAMEQAYSALDADQKCRVINLGIGDPDLPTPAPIRDAIAREHKSRYHGYPTSQGRLDLREALANHYAERFGVNADPDQFYIGPGAKTDLFDLNAVFAESGDSVIILDPAYPVYRDAAGYRQQRIHFLRGTFENYYQPEFDPDAIEGKIALIYLCYPNNPTGVTAERSYIRTMIDTALRFQCLIVMDIAYADFVPGNHPSSAFSIFELPGGEDVGIEVGSFSKPFSMTGDRLSWVLIKNPAVRKYWHRYRSNRDSGASNYDQAGGLAALTDPAVKPIVQSNFEIYGRRANILTNGLKMLGFPMTGLLNTPYAWFKTPFPNSVDAARTILSETGIILTPGSGFGPSGEGFLRATIFQPESRLVQAIDRLQKFNFPTK
ncbi:aminotransferase class I/II-fold pyridoxal phosphate-dependent enzyme [bacterium]|nr:aminotransferase class I/II-fold pyridoxal phosphate-dependent enzyme [candidate division CSSED10-310 bacterium]